MSSVGQNAVIKKKNPKKLVVEIQNVFSLLEKLLKCIAKSEGRFELHLTRKQHLLGTARVGRERVVNAEILNLNR